MSTLNSAGVSVTLIDESFYPEGGGGEGILIFAASRKNKRNPQGDIAHATLPENTGKLNLFTSRKNLNDAYGEAVFRNINGTPVHGDETNEYGIHTAFQLLGAMNNVSVVNADIDLDELQGSQNPPTNPAYEGTHWLDLSKTNFGIFQWSENEERWVPKEAIILNDRPGNGNVQPIANGVANPKETFGANGDIAVVTSISPIVFYHKIAGAWVMLGAEAHPYDFQFAPHTRIPTRRGNGDHLVEGDFMVKTTVPNSGAYFDLSVFQEEIAQFVTKDTPLFTLNDAATDYYKAQDELREGAIYVQIDHEGKLNPFYNVSSIFPRASDGVAVFTVKRHNGSQILEAVSRNDVPDVDTTQYPAIDFIINGVTVHLDASHASNGTHIRVEDIVNELQEVPELKEKGIRVELVGDKRIKLINTKGYDITIQNIGKPNEDWTPNTMSDTAALLGFRYYVSSGQPLYRKSNWEVLEYIADYDVPTREPDVGTLWYANGLRAEFLKSYFDNSDNRMKWKTYAFSEDDGTNGLTNKVAIRGSAPTNSKNGDLWIDTTDLENYPTVKEYRNGSWVTLKNDDQTTSDGILSANYAWSDPFDKDGNPRPADSIYSEYAPDPAQYPEGILLFNLDWSTYNVKEYIGDNQWVAVSGTKSNGVPYMGRKAVRAMVVKALKRAVITNKRARARNNHFYLLACPGYPEVMPELNSLNAERKHTGFVVGGTPMRLKSESQDVFDWANNTKGAFTNGEDGLVTYDNMSAVWAFSGIQSDQRGNTIAVPSDTLALQTIIQSDRMSYQWFAPAGDRRGIVPDTTAIGYVTNGQFEITEWDDGLMDTLYLNNINPIIQFEGEPIKVYGQRTLTTTASAMDRINVARLTAFLRYRLEKMVKPFLFEPNDTQTRSAVVSMVEGFLADIVSKRGIADFVVQCDAGNNTNLRIDRNELWIDISIVPMKAIEFIYIPVRLKNTGAL